MAMSVLKQFEVPSWLELSMVFGASELLLVLKIIRVVKVFEYDWQPVPSFLGGRVWGGRGYWNMGATGLLSFL